jgi:glycosyltransferase involved in cell wall biosynthesis
MKILLLNDDFPPHGNSSVATVAAGLVKEYAHMGQTVMMLTTHRTTVSPEIIRTDTVISLPIDRASRPNFACLGAPNIAAMLEQEIAAIKPDVVHAHNIHTYLTYDALRIAKNHTQKVFITLHDVMSFSYARLNTDRFLNDDDCHWTLMDHLKRSGLQYNPWRNRGIRNIFKKYVTAIFSVSDSLKQALIQNGMENVTVAHNGIDTTDWHATAAEVKAFQDKHGLTGRKTILFGGRLSVDKGSRPVLKALEELSKKDPSVLLMIIGDPKRWQLIADPSKEELLRKHCIVIGWLDRKDMCIATFAADVITTPSLCLDCFPTLNLEAMAAGKPVVGTIFGGTPEVVEHQKTGFICDPRNTKEYTGYLAKLLNDQALRTKMGDAGRARVENEFSVAKQTALYLESYAKAG